MFDTKKALPEGNLVQEPTGIPHVEESWFGVMHVNGVRLLNILGRLLTSG